MSGLESPNLSPHSYPQARRRSSCPLRSLVTSSSASRLPPIIIMDTSVCKIISHSDRGRAPAVAGHSPNYNHFITMGDRGLSIDT